MARTLDDLQTPALLIRLDRVRDNIAHVLASMGGARSRWRPHIKTAKIPEVLGLLLASGLRQFKCATTREASVLLARAEGPIDLLVAFGHRGPNLQRLAALAADYPQHRVAVLTEDAAHSHEVRAVSGRLGLFLDLDPGYHRTGIPLADRGRIAAVIEAAGEALAGLHYYDGHLHIADPAERAARCAAIYPPLLALADDCGLGGAELITSGTPTYAQALGFAEFAKRRHTVSPGTVVYSDVRTEEFGIRGLQRAAHVLTRVVSAPLPDRVTCDAGSKAVDAAAGEPCVLVEGWPGLVAEVPSEEHLPLAVREGRPPAPGTLLQLVPRHVCPTVNLADQAVLLDSESIVGIVPVTARGHEILAHGG